MSQATLGHGSIPVLKSVVVFYAGTRASLLP